MRGSYEWLPIKEPASYSECQLGPTCILLVSAMKGVPALPPPPFPPGGGWSINCPNDGEAISHTNPWNNGNKP
jgi:hypothetical protein